MRIDLELQVATNVKTVPHPLQFKKWVKIIFNEGSLKLLALNDNIEITIRIVDEYEIISLNNQYRNKNKPTNVLSFIGYLDPEFEYNVLGDLVICASVVELEAKQQNKPLLAHWAHMVIHGILHLLGYDHGSVKDAEKMEKLEIKLMRKLGFRSPY